MGFITEILDFVRTTRPRNVVGPNGKTGLLLIDGDGSECVWFKDEPMRLPTFEVGSCADMRNFASDLSKRFSPEVVKETREITVFLNENDTPAYVSLGGPHESNCRANAEFRLAYHEDFRAWFYGNKMTQAQFRQLLLEHEGQHDQPDLPIKLQVLEYKAEINFEASVATERNYVLAYSEKDGKGGLNIPKQITVTCPVVAGAETTVTTTFDIVLVRPTAEKPTLMFTLVPTGKGIDKIYRDACCEVVHNEVTKPILSILERLGVETLSPVYVRKQVDTFVYSQDKDTICFDSK